jgi:hypothetical protein
MTDAIIEPVGSRWDDDMRLRAASARPRQRHHRAGTLEYRLYTVLLFPLAVLAVLASRLTGRVRTPGRNFISEVMEFNRSTVPWIFMGR